MAGLADVGWGWWAFLGPLFAFVVWTVIDTLVVSPRRATSKFAGVQGALQRPVVRESEYLSSITWPVDDRPVTVRSTFIGGEASVRGMGGHLFVLATPLRVPAWAMHDVEVRQRRRQGDWDERFKRVESGIPVREGWATDPLRAAIAHFFDHPLAVGTLRTDRGELQHVASWSAVGDTRDPAAVRDLLTRFAGVAVAFDRAAVRPHPMA
ncbi:hypothetical protein TBR22_A16720 [Luteitalea sp. TBR-22]|uniref:hypothetical protein n=1 Tax=Luteitalea sp. TBR-22 TaxID=2802971 RepID=UPI001AF3330F|nr:hypothetical protein [Luteitalea sp. TBR-22]BCS32457.1 hypothetical protein TBR22_A16720 [Luteitalea sp. TBR-22]